MASMKKAATPTTSKARLASIIKSARDTMRKDAGINGDLDRLLQLSWLLFLKAFDQPVERERSLFDLGSRPVIEEPYRWQDWATNPDFGGNELKTFVNEELIPHLAELKGADAEDPCNVLSTIFKDVSNRMQSGILLRDLVNLIDKIRFDSSDDLHTMAFVYESILKETADAAGDSGEFYTPRPVNRFMVQQSFVKLGESILDPACGTGGFLAQAYENLAQQVKTDKQRNLLHTNIRGIEKKPLPHLLASMNLLLHGVDAPRLIRENALPRMLDATTADRVDVVLTNPPFGGEVERSIVERYPKDYQTRETSWLFLHAIMNQLRNGGRCAIILPNGNLFASGENSVGNRVKRKLLKECDLHTIIRLPPGVFAPYTQIPSNLLFFEKGRSTKEIWFYEISLPNGRRGYTKTKPMQFDEFNACAEWWGGENRERREAGGNAWKVPISDIEKSDYNLDVANPRPEDNLDRCPPKDLANNLIKSGNEILELLDDLRINLEGESLFDQIPEWKPLSHGLKIDIDEVSVEHTERYPVAGVHGFGRGLIDRGTISGGETKYTRFNRLHSGCLVMSRLKAFNGALAVVPSSFDGHFVSREFPTFSVLSGKLDINYLEHLCQWPRFWSLLGKETKGVGAQRERVSASRLLATKVPFPTMKEQQHIAATLDKVQAVARLGEHQEKLLTALRPAFLNAAFSRRL